MSSAKPQQHSIAIKPPAAASTQQPTQAAPPPTPNYPQAQCTIERAPTANAPQNVGEHLTLTCQGSFDSGLGQNAQVKPADGHEWSLYVLKVLDTSSLSFKAAVTSYRPGPHQNEVFVITDGQKTFQTSPLTFTVESVVQPKEGQQPQPFPSYGPFAMSYPLWLWLVIAGAILFIAGGIFWGIWRRRKRRKLLAELEKYMTMLPPFGQFSKDARMTVKKLGALQNDGEAVELAKKIDEDFRLYLIRELKVPALQTSNREIIREIKRSHPQVYHEYQGEIRRVLFELDRAARDAQKVKSRDCEELLLLSRKVADEIYAIKRKSKGAK